MVTRKPLPDNALVHPDTAPSSNLSGTDADPQTAAKSPPVSEQRPVDDAADISDTDSWERDTDTEDEEHEPSHANNDGTKDEGVAVAENGGILQPATTGESSAQLSTSTADTSTPGAGSGETNPFRRKMSQSNGQRSAAVPSPPSETPPLPPSAAFAKLDLDETSTNPWQPALGDQKSLVAPTLLTPAEQDPDQQVWASQVPSRAASTGPASNSPAIQSPTPEEKSTWGHDFPEKSAISVPPSFQTSPEDQKLEQDSHAWDNVATLDKGKAPEKPPLASETISGGTRDVEDNLIDLGPEPGTSPSGQPSQASRQSEEAAPALPPRQSEKALSLLPAAPVSGKTETYQIKNITWHDANAANPTRKSPILVQNANGPCPLMALVNALTLTTPADAGDAVLVNTLKTREQISLDLLLDAVFDELMSERRITPDMSLPDITELYAFLKGLHTGMNVNPRFVPTEETEKAFKRTSLTHLHPTERGELIPGTFEDTKEMSFYRTFRIPLIHGWLPPRSEPVYEALKRHAESYEDAQNLLFREEELEDKLSSTSDPGLSEEEQGIYQDILSIKSFLYSAATQLTPWGLEVITKAMRPGSVAILFRNDHFSTLYRHPQTLQMFALVTDAGYAGHDEIVWESLVDVNGEKSEFFSGDFLVVGGPSQSQEYAASGSASASNNQKEWTTVQRKGGKKSEVEAPPMSPKEQEDRDLALALQLQEEEDQRHRSEQAQRRRETQLSEQFIEQQGARQGPAGLRQTNSNSSSSNNNNASVTTGRRPSTARGGAAASVSRGGAQHSSPRPGQQQVRPLVPPVLRSRGVNRHADEGDDDAPPSYEDAARQSPYLPPAGHPSHPGSSSTPSVASTTQGLNNPRLPGSRAPGIASGSSPGGPTPGGYRRGANTGYRQGVPPTAAGGGSRDKDCIVM
jgi:ubiquitin carboxyl-terminal hydrolase MINDY-1/2